MVRRVNGSRCDHMFRLTAAKSKSKTKLCHRSSCKPGIKNEKGLPNFFIGIDFIDEKRLCSSIEIYNKA